MPGPRAGSRSKAVPGAATRKTSETATRKTSASTSKGRAARSSAVEIPDEGEDTSLRTRICTVFGDSQRNNNTHRKLATNLRKIQEACCYEPTKKNKKSEEEDFDEDDFNHEFGRCVLRVLAIKKSEPAGDRIIRFMGVFLRLASDKDNTIAQGEDEDMSEFPETPTSRLVSQILQQVLPLLAAKDKVVRYRATQLCAYILNTLDTIEDELFNLLRLGLIKRLKDKESTVRREAVIGLGRLAGNGAEESDDEDSDGGSGGGIMDKLLDQLQNDPGAEVRRSLLLNLDFSPRTLPYLLERARDSDVMTRRALYARVLPLLGDFRHLSLPHREKLLRWGLRDRDESVRKATAKIFREKWIEDCASVKLEEGQAPAPGKACPPSFEALLELLERIDVMGTGEHGIGKEAMREFWDGRPDYREFVTFDDNYLSNLTPESAFLLRTFNDYCRNSEDQRLQSMAEDKLPELTKFAVVLLNHLNVLLENTEKMALEPDATELEEDVSHQEFVIEQMLHIALTFDYTDEMGRRRMFNILREAISKAELPEESTKLAIEALRQACGKTPSGEREFISIVLEAVNEVHDTVMGDDAAEKPDDDSESFHSAQSELSEDEDAPKKSKKSKKNKAAEEEEEYDEEKAVREIMVNMKCLHLAQCMLQNVHCDLESNGDLVTMLNTLVVPAVRSHEQPVREKGLNCLGLCCLLSKDLSRENLTMFLHCFVKGDEKLQQTALETITDILMAYPSLLVEDPVQDSTEVQSETPGKAGSRNPLLKQLCKAYLKGLQQAAPPNSRAVNVSQTAAVSLSKLLLLHLFPPEPTLHLLKMMCLTYFNPETAENPGLRQALNYFLPVYCHSKKENAARFAAIVVPSINKLMDTAEEAEEEGEPAWVGWTIVIGMFAEWTDGRRVVSTSIKAAEKDVAIPEPHVIIAEQILERVQTCTKEERKPLFSLLSKLHIPMPGSKPSPDIMLTSYTDPTTTSEYKASLSTVLELVESTETRIVPDAPSRTALARLQTSLSKAVGEGQAAGQDGAEDEGEATEKPEEDGDETEKEQEKRVVEKKIKKEPENDDVTMAITEPDDEGTKFEEDEDGDTVMSDAPQAEREGSLVESLLDSET